MPTVSKPRAGSLQYWPRKRAKKIYSNIKSWKNTQENKLLGFIGYKVGMTHLHYISQNPSIKNKTETFSPVTIIECPPLKPFSIRFYKKTHYGSQVLTEILSKNLDKELSRKITLSKKQKDQIPEKYDYLKLLVYTQPKLTGIGKKKPEIIEMGISGDLEFAKSLLAQKEIKVSEVLKENQYVDIHAITKGKGLQGPVKRFGVSLKQHKSEKGTRRVGTLGNWTAKTWRVAHPGQMGFFKRTEHNKLIFKVGNEDIHPKSGFHKYGKIRNEYVMLRGSIAGPKKRVIIMTEPLRSKKTFTTNITSIKK
jgi:large subunit ribosomal protein L3